MTFTLSTLPLAILTIFLAYLAKWQLLPVTLFMSVFQAASILNIGNTIGVSISYLLLLIFLVSTYLFPRRTGKAGDSFKGADKRAEELVLLFTAYAALSAFLCPILFEGTLYSNPKVGSNVPLRWETGHLNQLLYLFLCVGLYFAVSRRASALQVQQALDWYVGGNILACLIGFYQLLCLRTGIPFPSEFLHTNPVYGIFEAYDIGGFARINSTFTEASAAAGSLTPALAIVLWRLLEQATWKNAIIALTLFAGLFLSISTTGYVSFGFLALLCSLLYLFRWGTQTEARVIKLFLGCLGTIVAIAMLVLPSVRLEITDLLNVVIFTKTSTGSYEERTQWNVDAWQTGLHTHWLGAGWGVCRASSLIPTLFGNIGLPGLLLLIFILVRVFSPAWKTSTTSLQLKGQIMLSAAVYLFGQFVAGPELTSPLIWFLFAAATTRYQPDRPVWIQRHHPAAASPRTWTTTPAAKNLVMSGMTA